LVAEFLDGGDGALLSLVMCGGVVALEEAVREL
jgi:hypothetical protein